MGATGGSLIVVGALICKSLTKVKWHGISHATTAFITVILMPLTYSIGYALIGGIGCWIIVQGFFTLMKVMFNIDKPNFEDSNDNNIMVASSSATAAAANVKELNDDDDDDGLVKVDVE